MKLHKHAELIKAWADGAEIESKVLDINGEWSKWESELNPSWHTSIKIEYRIKTEPKPDWDEYLIFFKEDGELIIRTYKTQVTNIQNPEVFGQLKVTIDGETGKLKSTEVLK